MPYVPLPSLVAERLESERPGLFTSELVWPPASSVPGLDLEDVASHLNPRLRCRRITSRHINRAVRALVASRRYPRALPKVIDDPDAWRRRAESRLERIRRLFDLTRSGGSPAARLELEASCAWVGPAAERPSRTLPTEALRDLASGTETPGTPPAGTVAAGDVAAIAALALGQRRAPGSVPAAGRAFHRLGSAFSGWPLDVLFICARVPATRRTLLGFRRHPVNSWLDGPEVGLALLEHDAVTEAAGPPPAGEPLPPLGGLLRLLAVLNRLQEHATCPSPAASLLGLSGRLSGRLADAGSAEDFLAACADWTDICGELVRPGDDYCAPLRVAIETLAVAAAHAGGEAARLEHAVRLLARAGGDVLEATGSSRRPAEEVRERLVRVRHYRDVPLAAALGRSPALGVDDLRLLLRHGRFGAYARAVARSPAYGELALRWARALSGTAGQQDSADPPPWAREISPETWAGIVCLQDRALAERLTGWFLDEARAGDPRRMARLPHLLEGLRLFLTEGRSRPGDRQEFLRAHWFLWGRLLEALPEDGAGRRGEGHDREVAEPSLADAVDVFLAAMYWEREAGRDPRPLGEEVLERDVWVERCARWTGVPHDPEGSLRFAVQLAGGDGRTLLGLLGHPGHHFWRRLRGPGRGSATRLRALLGRVPGLRSLAHEAAPDPAHGKRLLDVLHRVALAVRLFPAEDETEWMRDWISPPPVDLAVHDVAVPDFVEPRQRERLEALAAYRALAGSGALLPSAVGDILGRRTKLQRELRWLEERKEAGGLPDGAEARPQRLRDLLGDPRQVQEWVRKDLEDELPGRLVRARLEALNACADGAIARFWSERLGSVPDADADPAWENALSLYLSLQDSGKNRKILRRLLEARLAGRRDWHLAHPDNRRFLARLHDAGADSGAWLADHALAVDLGGQTWTACTEEDPLRVLRMGELFGTCLAPRGVEDHSTVANAVEANKRVLYLEDGAGAVVGRKLIAVSAEGVLVGFDSYGKFDRRLPFPEWVKITFDQLCLRIAERAGLRLYRSPEADDDEPTALLRTLALFAEGYLEWPEPFDGWVIELSEDVEPVDLVEDLAGRDEDQAARLVLWIAAYHPAHLSEALEAWRPSEEVQERLRANTESEALQGWLEMLRAISGQTA